MIESGLSLIGIIFTILFVIGTHEFGHFITAKLLGVKVLRFSIGFGKTILSYKGKSETEYVLAMIPLGGYVQMLDENEVDVKDDEKHRAYNQQPYYKKFLIALAGPLTNFLCALAIYSIIFMIGFTTFKPIIGEVTPNSIAAQAGLKANQEIIQIDGRPTTNWMSIVFRLLGHAGNEDQASLLTVNIQEQNPITHTVSFKNWKMNELTPDPLKSLGIQPYQPDIPLVIKTIKQNAPAAQSGLKVDDQVIAVNQINIKDWPELIQIIHDNPGKTLPFIIKRGKKTKTINVTIGSKRHRFFWNRGFLGIAPDITIDPAYLRNVQYPFFAAIKHGAFQVYDFCYYNFLVLGKLITGKLSVQSLGGPITIFGSAGSAIQSGALPFFSFLAFLSIAIGVINILPIPGLDGGHLLLETVQFIIRRPIPEKILIFLYRLGVFIIIFVMIQAVANDILRMT